MLGERVLEADPAPRRLHVDLVSSERETRGAERDRRNPLDERLHPHHCVPVVGVGLVPLEHRELGRVLVREALVPEVLPELVDALEPADDQPLEVELGRDPQVHVLAELVVVRAEGRREAAAVAWLEHGRLHLEEALLVEVAPDLGHGPRSDLERAPRLFVDQEVEVAPAIALLHVRQAVERVGKRDANLREQLELAHLERGLASARLGRMPADADDVTQFEIGLLEVDLLAHEELDPAASVDEVEEHDLSQVATGEHAAREPQGLRLVASRRAPARRRGPVRRRSRPGRESAWRALAASLSDRPLRHPSLGPAAFARARDLSRSAGASTRR